MTRTRRRTSSNAGNSVVNSAQTPKRSRISEKSDRVRRDALIGVDQKGRRRQVSLKTFALLTKALQSLGSNIQDDDTELRIKSIDLHEKENRLAHHTDEYEHEYLLIRRGQKFDVTITFDRAYDPDRDTVFVQFTTGSRPMESKGTLIKEKVVTGPPKTLKKWHAQYVSKEDTSIKVAVTSPADAIVGQYKPFVETISKDSQGITHQNRREFADKEFVVLFNPWCDDDDVYMEDEEERKEYVLNESGRIWGGTARSQAGQAWDFGQFEDVVLDCALWILETAELGPGARSSPVIISRVVSAWANNSDDNGILEGRWDDDFPKGTTEPWAWSGSVEIIEQFMKKKKSVQFGQCWVFSGLVTSLMRALGIPTRSVTNFESAHDCDASMTIDYHWSETNDPIEDLNDSIWNFHVWNESWFKRPDLLEGYDGWQAFDATPQEASEGVMRCGPAPVKAIKEGQVFLPYDGPFIFAEVNGDKVHWLVKENGDSEVISIEKKVIGKHISTKAVGSNEKNDITDLYKHEEGSEEERKAVHKAFRYSSRKDEEVYDIPEPDVHFTLTTPKAAFIGDDLELKVIMNNVSSEVRHVVVSLRSMIMFYTGVTGQQILSTDLEEELQPEAETERIVQIKAAKYEKILRPDAAIQVYMLGKVKDTDRSYAHMEAFTLMKPGITIKLSSEEVVLQEEFEVTVEFENPLKEDLKGGEFHIEAAGIVKSLVIPHKGKTKPGELVTATATLAARRSGTKEIVVSFSSSQLTGLSGFKEIYVKYGY